MTRLTKLGHACVRLEKDGAVLVIDPGAFSDPEALSGANVVLATHEHMDHLQQPRLRAALAQDPGLELWTNDATAAQFAEFGARVHTVEHGDTFSAGGFDVHVYGSEHAELHREIRPVGNIGFMLDGDVFHPGDSFTVPEDPVRTLLLPVSAPWLKLSEMIDYGRQIAPTRGLAIHDALLSDIGRAVLDQWLGLAAGSTGAVFSRLDDGAAVDL